jgi:hypothetical protein
MSRLFGAISVFLAAMTAHLGAGATAQDASLTRIEPRPFYGATVTIEEGVRVFRPLPPTRHMIINPQSQTPLNLSFTDIVERRATYESSSSSGNRNGGQASTDASDGASQADADGSIGYYGDGGISGATGGQGYREHNGHSYGAKGKRRRGFGQHGVRINGQAVAFISAADQLASPHHSRIGRQGPSGRNGYQTFTQRGIRPQTMPHGFHYGAGKTAGYSASRPLLPPLAYGARLKVQRGQAIATAAPPQVKVHRPSLHQHAPVMSYAPMIRQMPTHRIVTMPPVIHAPIHTAPKPAATSSAHSGHNHAPAGRMGMGMGGMGHGRGR